MDEKTLSELIDELLELQEEFGHCIVRIAYQPNYAIYAPVVAVHADEDTDRDAVYLAGGVEGSGYVADTVTQELKAKGWR